MASVAHPTLTTYIDGGKKVGDLVFAAVWYYSDDDPAEYGATGLKVAVISRTEMRVLKTIEDPSCVMAAASARLDNDDIIVSGDASTGVLNLFGSPAAPPNCLLRIKAGETEFDPTFNKVLDDITTHTAIVWARDPGTFATVDEFYTNTRWTPFAVDVNTWTGTQIVDPGLVAVGFPADTFMIDGVPHFTVARSDGEPGGALASYDNGVLTEQVLYTEWLQYAARVR